MARCTRPLSTMEIKQAQPRQKLFTLYDGFGLQCRVKPNGTKLWLLDYLRPFTRKRTCISLGSFPTLSLSEARDKATEYRKLLLNNIDPKSHKERLKRQALDNHKNTLQSVFNRWMMVKKTSISQDHAQDIERSLHLHIFPKLAEIPISELRADMMINVMQPLAHRGSLETVKRLCQRINEIMQFAINIGLIEANPLSGISQAFPQPTKQHLPTIQPKQLSELLSALQTADIRQTTRLLIEWQLHTMVRPSEASGARWAEINLTERLWIIPADRMKTSKNHTVPLSDYTVEILEQLEPMTGHSDYVFLSDRKRHQPLNSSTANVALKRMGFHGKLVAHGLRSLASTILNEEGFDPDLIETALAHTGKNEVRNAYNRAHYIERRATMMQWWSDHIIASGQ